MLDKPVISVSSKNDRQDRKVNRKANSERYCKDFNFTNGCILAPGHVVNVRREDKGALLCCAKCLGRKNHSRMSENDPLNSND